MSLNLAAPRKILAVTLMMTLAGFYCSPSLSALAQVKPVTGGVLFVSGTVMLNGMAAISGVSVFSKSTLKTAHNGSAVINLGRLGRVELGPDSEMSLRFSEDTVGGTLLSGKALFSASEGVKIAIVTADGETVSEGRQATVLTVDVRRGYTRVASSRGGAKVTAGARVEYVSAGQEVAVGNQAPAHNDKKDDGTGGKKEAGGLSSRAMTVLILAGMAGAMTGVVVGAPGGSDASGAQVSQSRP